MQKKHYREEMKGKWVLFVLKKEAIGGRTGEAVAEKGSDNA